MSITDADILAMANDDGLKQRILLNFKCSDLPNLDKKSKSDPYIVLWAFNPTKTMLGRTEVIKDSLNPEFV